MHEPREESSGNAPPELLDLGSYTMRSDLWAIGVTMYELMTKALPFAAPSHAKMIQNINQGNLAEHQLLNNSPHARDLIYRMLDLEPERRIALRDIFSHPWLSGN